MPSKRIVLVVGLAISFAACGSSDGEEAGTTPAATARAATTTPAPAGELEGTWRTDPVTVRDMTRTLREHDLAKWVQRFERNAPVSDAPTALVLEIGEGGWDLSGQRQGGGREEIDYDAQYELDGDRVVVSHENEANTYRWSVQGDSLTLAWLETTYGSYKGIPEEVFQRALYMTAEFRRAG